MVVMCTPSPITSGATQRENASSAAFEATYAENRGVFVWTPMLEMLMTWPSLRSRIPGMKERISRSAPK
jgi:hypothetical protein